MRRIGDPKGGREMGGGDASVGVGKTQERRSGRIAGKGDVVAVVWGEWIRSTIRRAMLAERSLNGGCCWVPVVFDSESRRCTTLAEASFTESVVTTPEAVLGWPVCLVRAKWRSHYM